MSRREIYWIENHLKFVSKFPCLNFPIEKKTLSTKKWEALNSCVIFLTKFLQDENLNELSFPSLMLCLEFSFELLLNMYEGYFPVNKMALSSSTWPHDEDLRFTSMNRSRFGDFSIKTHSVTSKNYFLPTMMRKVKENLV
jgi:hypothetical protein